MLGKVQFEIQKLIDNYVGFLTCYTTHVKHLAIFYTFYEFFHNHIQSLFSGHIFLRQSQFLHNLFLMNCL